jgi:hypothetical protein
LEGNHVFALPSCIASFHLPSPRMGSARGSSALSSLEERNFAEVGTFQPSFGFKDFHQAPSPALRRRRPLALPGKANCCCPARMQHSVLCPRFRGEDRSEDLPVRFGAACARWCGVGGQADTAVGADVVAAGESFSAVKAVSAAYGPTSGSLALMSGSRPLSGDANKSLPVAASVLGPWLLL